MSKPVIIVSAFFKIPSKQPYDFYREHLRRWFRAVSSDVIFFTSQDVWDDIQQFGIDLRWITPQIMNICDWKAWELGMDFWRRQMERDPEKYHTCELAAVWYEKKEFVKRAMDLIEADVYIWCDAGCVRNDISEGAMQQFGKRGIQINDNRLHIQCISSLPYKPFYHYPDCKYAGAIQAGNRTAWLQYDQLYRRVIQEYDVSQVSCNSDQYVLASCYDLNSELFYEHRPSSQSFVDPWFFFLEKL